MSTTELGRFDSRSAPRSAAARDATLVGTLRMAFGPLASLRLTVTLLGLSIILVLAGTLAQVDHDVLYVLQHYFRTWIAWIELAIFFPREWGISPSLRVPFPGGKLIGLALAINLVSAHGLRFRVAARGRRLWLGWATILAGCVITYAVVKSGANIAVESELSPRFTNGLWHALRAALGASALSLVYVLALTRATARKSAAWWLWLVGAVIAVLIGALAVYLFTHPAVRLDASGLRILWQLAKATGASLVLGAGCWAVFSKRAGIVLLHGGIGLMMFTELYTAQNVVEARMTIAEGETAYFADDIRSVELAFTDVADAAVDRVVAIPASMLVAAWRSGDAIQHPDLPFDVRVTKYLPNARTRRVQPGETSDANAGGGQFYLADERPGASGVEMAQTVDLPVALVELLDKGDGASRGKYVTSLQLRSEALSAAGKNYEMALRFKRIPKPYQVTLLDFKFDRYIGSSTAKNYESIVRFQDPAQNVDHRASIRMNNPLRYGGDTLYQASFDEKTEQGTVLQVMTNAGWMVPYVACMIVAAGMLVHFTQAIIRFILRREDEARREAFGGGLGAGSGGANASSLPWLLRWRRAEYWVPALIVAVAAATTARYATPPKSPPLAMKLYDFGRLPVAYGGRTQPMDSLAQNALRVVSGKATFKEVGSKERLPAIRWLLDVVSPGSAFRDHRVIRIENLDVLEALNLPQRPGEWRYSLAEIYADVAKTNSSEFERQVQMARAVPENKRDLAQEKILEASTKVRRVLSLRQAFDMPDVGERGEGILRDRAAIEEAIVQLNEVAPKPVPPDTPDGQWLTVFESTYDVLLDFAMTGRNTRESAGTRELLQLLIAYGEGNAQKFNAELAEYQKLIAATAEAEADREQRLIDAGQPSNRKPAERLALDRIAFESFFNHFDPFIVCMVFYIAAFGLAALAWIGWPRGFNRAANWLLWFTFALHTFGLICRIYISGRPPVTNLYSSAVFIGWAGVLLALLFEAIYKLGVGNLLAAVLGVPTMIIAYQLTFDADGDTLGVMQAVLDTNFWLGTHVVCIALGYATTLGAGALGLITLTMGTLGGRLDDHTRRQITRMTYGTICFAIFFSFIGTVLGGLWADDSWGRFWGWDPKENGALMIVLWNAIVLHARWGKMCGERGLAALAVAGSIVVAWSWWGVNQLGVGLHSYGKASGITLALTVFDVAMLAVIAAAYAVPWMTTGARASKAAAPA